MPIKTKFNVESEDAMKLSLYLSNGQTMMLSCTNSDRTINGIVVVSWVTPTSNMPLLFTASVGSGGVETGVAAYRYCYSLIDETKEFGINVPTVDLVNAVLKVGTTHSNEVDKFAEAELTPMPSKQIAAPLLEECYINIECKVVDQFVTGDHTVFVGKPLEVHMNDDVFTDGAFSEKYRDKNNMLHFCDALETMY